MLKEKTGQKHQSFRSFEQKYDEDDLILDFMYEEELKMSPVEDTHIEDETMRKQQIQTICLGLI